MRVLVVEDNPADARMAELILKEAGLPHDLTVVVDGAAALAFLNQDPPYTKALLPELVLLDLYLPKVDGVAVLQAIQHIRRNGRMITAVIVLSGLRDPNTQKAAAALGADACFAKPQGLDDLRSLASNLNRVWTDAVLCADRT